MKKKKKKNIKFIIPIIILVIIIIFVCCKLVAKDNIKKYHFSTSNDISIRYAYGLGVSTISQRNQEEPYLDITTIKPEGKELKSLKKAIKNSEFVLDKNIDSAGVAGVYELTIGNDIVFFDQEEGIYTNDSKTFYKIDISTELFDTVSDIVFNYVNDKQESIKTNEIYISNNEIGETTFTNKNTINDIINTFRYVKLKSNSDDLDFEEYYIDFKNGITITTYINSDIARYKNSNTNEELNILLYNNPTEYLRNFLEEKIALDEGEKAISQ